MHRVRTAAVALLIAGALAACSSGAPSGTTTSPSASASASESATAQGDGSGDNSGSVDVTFSGDTVEPSGERVEVAVGSEVLLNITADAPGSLHVHTTPEQEIHYGKGTTTAAISVDQPGVIEVESHDLGVVVLQLQAS